MPDMLTFSSSFWFTQVSNICNLCVSRRILGFIKCYERNRLCWIFTKHCSSVTEIVWIFLSPVLGPNYFIPDGSSKKRMARMVWILDISSCLEATIAVHPLMVGSSLPVMGTRQYPSLSAAAFVLGCSKYWTKLWCNQLVGSPLYTN